MMTVTMMTTQICDHDIIEQVLHGDRESFGMLVQRYQTRLIHSVSRVLSCPSDAEDIVQEAFVRGYLNLSRFRQQSSLLTWLHRIAMNLAFTHERRARRSISWSDNSVDHNEPVNDEATSPEGKLLRQEESDALTAALQQLNHSYREILTLRELEGCDYKTIAARLRIPMGTVRVRLHRGREQLRALLRNTVA